MEGIEEVFNFILQEPNERTLTLPFPKHHTLGTLEDRIEEITGDAEDWPHFRRDQFLIIILGIIINERYTRNVKIQDMQGNGS